MQELPRVHLPAHAGIEPRVVERLADVLKSHPIGREDVVDELGVGRLVLGVWGQVAQDFSQLRAEVTVQVLCLCQFFVSAARHVGVLSPLLLYAFSASLLLLQVQVL